MCAEIAHWLSAHCACVNVSLIAGALVVPNPAFVSFLLSFSRYHKKFRVYFEKYYNFHGPSFICVHENNFIKLKNLKICQKKITLVNKQKWAHYIQHRVFVYYSEAPNNSIRYRHLIQRKIRINGSFNFPLRK